MEFDLSKLVTAKNNYDDEIEKIEKKLKKYIKFRFAVFHQPSDGFVILCEETARNAPLSNCLAIIKQKGKLSNDDYERECI